MKFSRNLAMQVPALLLMAVLIPAFSADAAIFTWNGGGGDGEWTTATNWTLTSGTDAGLNGYPDATDSAYPIAAANINLTGALSVHEIYWVSGANDIVNGVTITGDTLTVAQQIRKDRQGDLRVYNDIIIPSTLISQNSNSPGSIQLFGDISGAALSVRNGPTELSGSNTHTSNSAWSGATTEIVVRNPNALGTQSGTWEVAATSTPTLSFASDATFNGGFRVTNAGSFLQFRIVDSGAADRMFTVKGGTTNHPGSMQFVPNEAGSTGDLTLRWLRETAGTNIIQTPLITLSNSIVQLDTMVSGSVITLADGLSADGIISGAGRVVKSGPGTVNLQVAQSYTGGTEINGGVLQLASGFTGSLPDAGEVKIATGATFKLNGINDTIGSLSGTGNVDLDSATLTLSEGIRPGSSAGTLVIEDAGTLQLQGTSIFELSSLSGPNDLVQLTGMANLELGGVLQVLNLGGLEVGQYKLFDLNGGAISGSFSEISVQGKIGILEISGGDVFLNVLPVPEPSSALLVAMGILSLMKLRRRQS